jgi:hypothetical protein
MKLGKVVSWVVLAVFAIIGIVIVWALLVRWIALG